MLFPGASKFLVCFGVGADFRILLTHNDGQENAVAIILSELGKASRSLYQGSPSHRTVSPFCASELLGKPTYPCLHQNSKRGSTNEQLLNS
eukprot:3965854-Amphidinium_carterae.1